MQLHTNHRARRAPAKQKGVIVFIALIVLVSMTLAALALIRSTDTGTVIAGNLAFKQATASAADTTVEVAYRQLINADALGTGVLNNDNAFPGYHSSAPSQPEPTYTDPTWFQANGTCAVAGCAADANGNVTYYVVHRMCTQANTTYNGTGATGQHNTCATLTATGGSSTGGSMGVGSYNFQTNPQLYYRVTTLVVGPRNTEAVVQAMVALSN
jgi:Tfp pilus assembly protein PilX